MTGPRLMAMVGLLMVLPAVLLIHGLSRFQFL
jgi:hypothetical protein